MLYSCQTLEIHYCVNLPFHYGRRLEIIFKYQEPLYQNSFLQLTIMLLWLWSYWHWHICQNFKNIFLWNIHKKNLFFFPPLNRNLSLNFTAHITLVGKPWCNLSQCSGIVKFLTVYCETKCVSSQSDFVKDVSWNNVAYSTRAIIK